MATKSKMQPIEITPDMTDEDLKLLMAGGTPAPKKANTKKPVTPKNVEPEVAESTPEEVAAAMGDLAVVDLGEDEPLFGAPDEVERAELEDAPVQTICPKCGSIHSLQSLSWGDLKSSGILSEHAVEGTLIERQCARCNFQARKKTSPMTEEQKAKRREYNKTRNQRLKKEAQAMLDELSK